MNRAEPGLVALLLVRGCPEHCLTHAYEWLAGRAVPSSTSDVLQQVDEAISVAASITPEP